VPVSTNSICAKFTSLSDLILICCRLKNDPMSHKKIMALILDVRISDPDFASYSLLDPESSFFRTLKALFVSFALDKGT